MTARTQADEALIKSEARLAEAQAVAHIGSWEMDIASGQTFWSAEMFRLLEFDPAEGLPAHERFLTRIHPEDVPLYIAMEKKAKEEGEPRVFDIRVRYADGREGWLHARGRSEKNEEGKVVKTFGTVMDITESKRAEAILPPVTENGGHRAVGRGYCP